MNSQASFETDLSDPGWKLYALNNKDPVARGENAIQQNFIPRVTSIDMKLVKDV